MREELKHILENKKENIAAKNMLEFFEYFTDEEIRDIYTLVSTNDPIIKREILTKHISEYENTINEIIKIGLQFEKMKTIMIYDGIRKQSRESLNSLKQSINLNTNIEA